MYKFNRLIILITIILPLTSIIILPEETYEYDEIGRLVKVTYDDNTSIEYSYDDSGNIINIVSKGIVSVEENDDSILEFISSPNPFEKSTKLSFRIDEKFSDVKVILDIFGIDGKFVKRLMHRKVQPGYIVVEWDGKNMIGKIVDSGIYICNLSIGSIKKSIEILYIK